MGNHYSNWLKSIGFEKSISCPNAFYCKQRALRIIVHGDDFLTGGPEGEMEWRRGEMNKKYEAKHCIIGPRPDMSKSVKVLNRQITWEEGMITVEADKRHVEKAIQEMGLDQCKSVSTPGMKDKEEKHSKKRRSGWRR